MHSNVTSKIVSWFHFSWTTLYNTDELPEVWRIFWQRLIKTWLY